MSAVDETPEREASAKIARHLAGAVQMAEAIFRMRQQAADRQASTDQLLAGAARAERSAQHAADRLRWTQATAKQWTQAADLPDLGRAWAAAAGWADTDPTADVAATRVESRLADLAPNAMARYDDLRQDGWTRVDAMRDVLPWLALEDHLRSQDRRVFVAEPGQTTTMAAAAAAHAPCVTRGIARIDCTPSSTLQTDSGPPSLYASPRC